MVNTKKKFKINTTISLHSPGSSSVCPMWQR